MIRIGTRGSALALAQTKWVASQLENHGHEVAIQVIKTKGDLVQDRFDKMEGKGFFTKEIEDALSTNRIDLAVHSLKDLPTAPPEGLCIRAIPKRESPLDVLVTKPEAGVGTGKTLNIAGRKIGTSSNRRVSCLSSACPGAIFIPIRGNVPTRISKLQENQVDAIVLAQAGLNRLGLDIQGLLSMSMQPEIMVPAPGQGALAIQTRIDFHDDLTFIHDVETASCTQAERDILAYLQGGCQLPLGVLIQRRSKGHFGLHLFLGFQEKDPIRLNLQGSSPQNVKMRALARLDALLKKD